MEIQLLKKHGLSLRQIAQEVGCAVNTVRHHLAMVESPKYERKAKKARKLAGHEDYLISRQESARPLWIPATVLYREICARGYQGGQSQLRAFMRTLKPMQAVDALVRFETGAGEQMQVDWVEFRKGIDPLYAFCATLGYSRASYVEFVSDMKVETLIACHQHAFESFGGVVKRVLYDNMKTVVLERDSYGEGQHRYHAGFLEYAKHSGFIIKLCRPYRAKTKGKVERFNGYLRRSFYVPLVCSKKQEGIKLDLLTANVEVAHWLKDVANERIHGTTKVKPNERLQEERPFLQALPAPWRADIAAARPKEAIASAIEMPVRPAIVIERLHQEVPQQHTLAVYEQLLQNIAQGVAA